MAEKKDKFSFKKLFFIKGFFGSLVGKSKLEDKPLNWLSILLLIGFDIFIFVNILDGLDNMKDNITSPSVKYDYTCRDFFSHDMGKNFSYNQFESINAAREYGSVKNMNAPFYNKDFQSDERSEYCKKLTEIFDKARVNSDFQNTLVEYSKLLDRLNKLEREKGKYERDYDEFRDDYASGLGDYDNRISNINNDTIRADYNAILFEIETLNSQKHSYEGNLNSLVEIRELKSYIQENKQQFHEEESHDKFWYPVYVTLMESILIIPIFLLSIFLYKFALKRNRRILGILSSNLALISGVFVFIILFKIIYWIVPKKILTNLLTYLASIKALAVWNYLLTIFGIIIFGLGILFSQRAIDKYAKLKEERKKEIETLNFSRVAKERYWKKMCIDCDTKLLEGASHCSNCGVDQYKECSKCNNRMPKAYTNCEKCGTKN